MREVDLGFNLLSEIPSLLQLNFLVKLDLSRNLIVNAGFLSKQNSWPYLRDINLLGNKIERLPPILLKNLRKINLNFNNISTVEDFNGHPLL